MPEARAHEPLDVRLRDFLESLDYSDKSVRVETIGASNVIGVITTPEFEELDEAERQSQVWAEIHKTFSDYDQKRIEFIFTNTPEEEGDCTDER